MYFIVCHGLWMLAAIITKLLILDICNSSASVVTVQKPNQNQTLTRSLWECTDVYLVCCGHFLPLNQLNKDNSDSSNLLFVSGCWKPSIEVLLDIFNTRPLPTNLQRPALQWTYLHFTLFHCWHTHQSKSDLQLDYICLSTQVRLGKFIFPCAPNASL